ncbi:maleate cis-trans isomerase family protein [Variovorax sp. YR566]|uniref:maleate cis-trans isomerase family protein n=1 Tax=Variovorax sp. YR566 TaxID=3450237 RepID=UPI003F80F12B
MSMPPVTMSSTHSRGGGYGWRMRLGMLLPSSNPVGEPEIAAMLPPGMSLHTTRLKLAGSSAEELLAMTEKVEEGASLLADAGVDLIAFNCTAVSTFDAAMAESIRVRISAASGVPAISTADGILAGFKACGAKRVVLVTPYIDAINEREIVFLARHGIEVVSHSGRGLAEGQGMASIEPGEWYRRALALRNDRADAYFLSCTAIRVLPIIEALERDLGRLVLTSNQALVWHALRTSGFRDAAPGLGSLFQF